MVFHCGAVDRKNAWTRRLGSVGAGALVGVINGTVERGWRAGKHWSTGVRQCQRHFLALHHKSSFEVVNPIENEFEVGSLAGSLQVFGAVAVRAGRRGRALPLFDDMLRTMVLWYEACAHQGSSDPVASH